MQKRLFDIGWSNESKRQACHKEEGTEKHRLYQSPGWNEVRRRIAEACRKRELLARTSKNEWKWQRGIVINPLNESQWNRGQFSMKKKVGVRESTRVCACQQKGSKATLQLTALFWVQLESVEHVVGQWCNWILMKSWDLGTGCMARWMQNSRSSAPSRGRS